MDNEGNFVGGEADEACGAVPIEGGGETAIESDYTDHDGTKCSVSRDGMIIVLVGVRIKF